MINQKIRYSIIHSYFAALHNKSLSICEIGSGSQGMGRFFPQVYFTGIDVDFLDYSHQIQEFPQNMQHIYADVTQKLPFKKDTFDLVFTLDTFEHLPSSKRTTALNELIRISKHRVIIGFPCGRYARQLDTLQARFLVNLKKPVPDWLTEHLSLQYPEEHELDALLNRLDVAYSFEWNESIFLHGLIQLFEMFTKGSSFFDKFVPFSLLHSTAQKGKHFYRKYYIITKN